jgi:hypothetical protein
MCARRETLLLKAADTDAVLGAERAVITHDNVGEIDGHRSSPIDFGGRVTRYVL